MESSLALNLKKFQDANPYRSLKMVTDGLTTTLYYERGDALVMPEPFYQNGSIITNKGRTPDGCYAIIHAEPVSSQFFGPDDEVVSLIRSWDEDGTNLPLVDEACGLAAMGFFEDVTSGENLLWVRCAARRWLKCRSGLRAHCGSPINVERRCKMRKFITSGWIRPELERVLVENSIDHRFFKEGDSLYVEVDCSGNVFRRFVKEARDTTRAHENTYSKN